ncbi:hypothetical protein DGWBC_1392 [Dehalogenimonas sp. WBC-2]|nr:hypothetical protein DGWBC_1392 [Dehalogenimonas sp. WBC-2]
MSVSAAGFWTVLPETGWLSEDIAQVAARIFILLIFIAGLILIFSSFNKLPEPSIVSQQPKELSPEDKIQLAELYASLSRLSYDLGTSKLATKELLRKRINNNTDMISKLALPNKLDTARTVLCLVEECQSFCETMEDWQRDFCVRKYKWIIDYQLKKLLKG